MDPLTLGGTIVGILAAVAGIVAAVFQVREYLEKRRERAGAPGRDARPAPPAAGPQVPHNLPPRREFVGREREKARVHEALRSRSYLVSIDGIGGIGKTVLALEVAHECLRASRGDDPAGDVATFDGFIWTTAKDRDLTLDGLLDAVARTLAYPGVAQQPLEDKRDAVQKLLRERPYLLVVDNFETIADEGVRDFLLELPEPSKALITTRQQKLRRAWAVSLKGLAEPEALALIRSQGNRLGLAALERAADPVLLRLYEATGGAPLAIKWAVGQIKQRGQSLDTVLAALHGARGDIFDYIFARSWELVSEDARRVLTVMPLFATSASREAIEAASDVRHFALDEALGQLVEMSLVDATDELDLARRRYSVHPLARAFAAAKSKAASDTQEDAWGRLAAFFRAFTGQFGGAWNQDGFARLEPELPNVLATIGWCWEQQRAGVGLDIFDRIIDFLLIRGYWNDAMALGQQAMGIATQMGDESRAAFLQIWPIGWLHRHRGDLGLSEAQVTQALVAFERLGEAEGISLAKRHLGRIALDRRELARAEDLFREALAFYQPAQYERQRYQVIANLANVAMERDDLSTAWTLCHSVLEPARRFGDPQRVSHLLGVLAGVARRRGELAQARAYGEESLGLAREMGRLDAIADNQFWLAKTEMEVGSERLARQRLLDALEIYRRLDMESNVREIEALLARLGGPAD